MQGVKQKEHPEFILTKASIGNKFFKIGNIPLNFLKVSKEKCVSNGVDLHIFSNIKYLFSLPPILQYFVCGDCRGSSLYVQHYASEKAVSK